MCVCVCVCARARACWVQGVTPYLEVEEETNKKRGKKKDDKYNM